jgi:hypothetical protein
VLASDRRYYYLLLWTVQSRLLTTFDESVYFKTTTYMVPIIGWDELQLRFENAGRRLEQLNNPMLEVLLHVLVRPTRNPL